METIEILQKCTVVGNLVRIPDIKLDQKNDYFPLKAKLESIGGKWNTRAQGFLFEMDPSELLAKLQRGEEVEFKEVHEEVIDQAQVFLEKANRNIQEMKKYLNPEEMNFFKQVSELVGESEISFSLKVKNGTMTVMITRGQTASSKPIPPLIINGTPSDLDEGFFGEISTALAKVAGISSNAKAVEQAIDGTEGSATTSETPKAEPGKKSRSKAVKPVELQSESETPVEDNSDAVGAVILSVQENAEAVDTEEQERIRLEEEQKSQEEHRLKLEQEEKDRLDLERKTKFNEVSAKADHLAIGGTAADLRAAAFALKEAKEFTDDPDALTGMIKAFLTTAAQLEMEEL